MKNLLRRTLSLITYLCIINNFSDTGCSYANPSYKQQYLLSVGKKELTAKLQIINPHPQPHSLIKSYSIALGKEQGDKMVAGDNKTPEGIYFPTQIKNTRHLDTTKYGNLAIILNYPNSFDVYKEKTGYGIWLHGAGDNERISKKHITEGCIAFYNDDLEEIAEILEPKQSIVVIAPALEDINKEEDLIELNETFQAWLKAWQDRKLINYKKFYHADFKFEKKNLKRYLKHKKKVFQHYKQMTIDINDLSLISHPQYLVTTAQQYFNGDNRFMTHGKKTLYWQRTKQGLKIIREVYQEDEPII